VLNVNGRCCGWYLNYVVINLGKLKETPYKERFPAGTDREYNEIFPQTFIVDHKYII
jgi:hypothetical protein